MNEALNFKNYKKKWVKVKKEENREHTLRKWETNIRKHP